MVKSAPKVVDEIARNGGKSAGCGIGFRDVIDQASGIRITLGSESIGIGRDERVMGLIEIQEVLVGPFGFGVDQGKSLVCGHGGVN
jgi:hypothetical protein